MELPAVGALVLAECRGDRLAERHLGRLLRDKGFLRDVRDHAVAALDTYPYADALDVPREPNRLSVYAAGALSPLSDQEKCEHPQCRLRETLKFARTLGLYADYSIIADSFSSELATDEAPHRNLRKYFGDVLVLRTLRPLVEAGAVRFARPAYARCAHHARLDRAAERRAAGELWRRLKGDASILLGTFERRPAITMTSKSVLFTDGAPINRVFLTNGKMAKHLRDQYGGAGRDALSVRCLAELKPFVLPSLARTSARLVFDVRQATNSGAATLAVNSRGDALAMRAIDGLDMPPIQQPEWETVRSATFPWLDDLTPREVVQLRQDAGVALPEFRALLRTKLLSLEAQGAADEKVKEIAAELRDEALSLDDRLRSLNIRRIRRSTNLLATLGFGLAIYGLGTESPSLILGGFAGFASLLAAAHNQRWHAEDRQTTLIHKPAYVLVSARRILEHRH